MHVWGGGTVGRPQCPETDPPPQTAPIETVDPCNLSCFWHAGAFVLSPLIKTQVKSTLAYFSAPPDMKSWVTLYFGLCTFVWKGTFILPACDAVSYQLVYDTVSYNWTKVCAPWSYITISPGNERLWNFSSQLTASLKRNSSLDFRLAKQIVFRLTSRNSAKARRISFSIHVTSTEYVSPFFDVRRAARAMQPAMIVGLVFSSADLSIVITAEIVEMVHNWVCFQSIGCSSLSVDYTTKYSVNSCNLLRDELEPFLTLDLGIGNQLNDLHTWLRWNSGPLTYPFRAAYDFKISRDANRDQMRPTIDTRQLEVPPIGPKRLLQSYWAFA